jgi:hypothetical protein
VRTTQPVIDGRVDCPNRGDVDVEECWFCLAVEDIRADDGHEVELIVCLPEAARPVRADR